MNALERLKEIAKEADSILREAPETTSIRVSLSHLGRFRACLNGLKGLERNLEVKPKKTQKKSKVKTEEPKD